MKRIYSILTVASLTGLAFYFLVRLPTPRSEMIAAALAKNPESWTIQFKDDAPQGLARDPQFATDRLSEFLKSNPHPSQRRTGYCAVVLVTIGLFSILGWVRERKYEHKLAERGGPANPPKAGR